MMDDLTIITIGLKLDRSVNETRKSLTDAFKLGAKWVGVFSEKPYSCNFETDFSELIIGSDSGLYNALNLGLDCVKTDYFIILHSGDKLIFEEFRKVFGRRLDCDLVLGGARIGKRLHTVRKWKSWMLNLYIQPPHLPILYRNDFVGKIRFSENLKVVSDYYMVKELFQKYPRVYKADEIYVEMALGGLTTKGVRSIFDVTREFFLKDGPIAYVLMIPRILIKLVIR